MDTIFALASAFGRAGVAVIRISGDKAFSVLCTITSPEKFSLTSNREKSYQHAYAYFKKFYDGDILLDQGIVIYFQKPKSYTGEDVVEFQIHGSYAVIQSFFNVFRRLGLRMAEAGEFTRRSLINGKQDILQIEGVLDLIHSETEEQRKQAIRCLSGQIGKIYSDWYNTLKNQLAFIEAIIDFGEDIGDINFDTKELKILLEDIQGHLLSANKGISINNGFRIVIIGPPNAGKSSFINFLAKKDVSIVSEESGTTRDIIEVSINLNGYLINFSDTAGLSMLTEKFYNNQLLFDKFLKLRVSIQENKENNLYYKNNPYFLLNLFLKENFPEINAIEREGICRADMRANESDLLLFFSDDINIFPFLIKMYSKISFFCLLNKIDKIKEFNVFIENNQKKIFIKDSNLYLDNVFNNQLFPISIKKEKGIDDFLNHLEKYINKYFSGYSPVITRERHKESLNDTVLHLNRAIHASSLDKIAEDIRLAVRSIGKIIGKTNIEDILDIIFSDFCIGK